MRILFLHGLESRPGGQKSQHLQRMGHHVLNPQLPPEDFQKSVQIAQAEVDKHTPDLVVGSSRGGAVAMSLDLKGARLVLVAPAWKKYDANPTVPIGTFVLHSRDDGVIPFEESKEITGRLLVECGSDHRMSDASALQELEKAVKVVEKELSEKKRKSQMFMNIRNPFSKLFK